MLDPHRNALAIMQLKYGGEMVDHVGFGVTDYSRCKAFYERALAPLGITLLMESVAEAGGTHNGAPGVRETHHPNCHAAYVLDPDGSNVEAVCHTPA